MQGSQNYSNTPNKMSLEYFPFLAPPPITIILLSATPTTAKKLLAAGRSAILLHDSVDGLKAHTSLV